MIVDIQGHSVNGGLVPKEMAMYLFGWPPMIFHTFFYSEDWLRSMTKEDKAQERYVVTHGDYDVAMVRNEMVTMKTELASEVLKRMYPRSGIVAYRGGALAKTMLNELEIPCVNLAGIDCPRYDELIACSKDRLQPIHQCGHHFRSICPKQRVYLYAMWLKHYRSVRNMIPKDPCPWGFMSGENFPPTYFNLNFLNHSFVTFLRGPYDY